MDEDINESIRNEDNLSKEPMFPFGPFTPGYQFYKKITNKIDSKLITNNKLTKTIRSFPNNSPEYIKQYQEAHLFIIGCHKKMFQLLIDKIHELIDDTLLTRSHYKLDSAKKKDLESCQQRWNDTMHSLDCVENNIKKTINNLLKLLQSDESNESHHNYTMIKKSGFQDVLDYEDGFVPDVLQEHLFSLLNYFCYLCSGAMYALSIQYDVNSIFENDPQEIVVSLKRELIKLTDSFFDCQRLIEKQHNEIKELKETFAEKRKFKATTQKVLAKWIRSGIAKYCWKNRGTVKERIKEGFKLPNAPTLIKTLNHWNRYLQSSSEQQKEMMKFEPYHNYSEMLYASEETVKEWGEQTFAPTYIKNWRAKKKEKEEKRRKNGRKRPDALDRFLVEGDAGEKAINSRTAKKLDEDSSVYFDDLPPKKRRGKRL